MCETREPGEVLVGWRIMFWHGVKALPWIPPATRIEMLVRLKGYSYLDAYAEVHHLTIELARDRLAAAGCSIEVR